MDFVMKKMIMMYDLHKKQAYVDRLMKEGEIQGYEKILRLHSEHSDHSDHGDLAEGTIINLLKLKITTAKDDLSILKAKENILDIMNEDLQNILMTMDIDGFLPRAKYPVDVQDRLNAGLCALKRPGQGKAGFICDNAVIPGSKYCKEHLKKYDPITYADVYPDEGSGGNEGGQS